MDSKLNVLYCADQNYYGLLKLSLYSLLKYNRNLNIHIFTMDAPHTNQESIPQSFITQLNTEIQQIDKNSQVFIYDVRDLYEKHLKKSVNDCCKYTPYASLRLLVLEVFKDSGLEMLLYLDCDTIICSNLRNINYEYLEKAFLTVTKAKGTEDSLVLENHTDYVNLKDSDQSFYQGRELYLSGVIYFNFNLLNRFPQVMYNIIEFYNERHLDSPDQEAISFVPYNKYALKDSFSDDFYDRNTRIMHYHYNDPHSDIKILIDAVAEAVTISEILDDAVFLLLVNKISKSADCAV